MAKNARNASGILSKAQSNFGKSEPDERRVKSKRGPAATPTYARLARRSKARSNTGTDQADNPAVDTRGRKPGHDCRRRSCSSLLAQCTARSVALAQAQ